MKRFDVTLNGEPAEQAESPSAPACALDQVAVQLGGDLHQARHVVFRVPKEKGRASAFIYGRAQRDPETAIHVREVSP